MKALILLSHGSRRQASNDEMYALADGVRGLEDNPFTYVACAFQQFAKPSFAETCERLVRQDVTELVVFPLFLSSGNHVLIDVPEMIAAVRKQFPAVIISVTPHLGKTKGFAAFLLDRALSAPDYKNKG